MSTCKTLVVEQRCVGPIALLTFMADWRLAVTMGVGKGVVGRGGLVTLDFDIFLWTFQQKKGCFLSSAKNKISPLTAPPKKILENSLLPLPLEKIKNPSDAHDRGLGWALSYRRIVLRGWWQNLDSDWQNNMKFLTIAFDGIFQTKWHMI